MASKKSKAKPKRKAEPRTIIPFPLQGVPEVMETEIARQTYKDALSKPLKAAANVTTDILEGLRLFTAPFALAAKYTNRLLADLAKCRDRVPPERQVEAPPEIAGPIIQQLRFMDDKNPLRQMYLNLLTTSIDKDRQNRIHPAFVSILPQLSPDEGKLLEVIRAGDFHVIEIAKNGRTQITHRYDPMPALAFPEQMQMYLSRLDAMTLLLRITGTMQVIKNNEAKALEYANQEIVLLSSFGRLFSDAIGPAPVMTKDE